MMRTLVRAGLGCVLVAMVALGLGPLGRAATAGALDGVTLRVGTWGGPWRDIQQELLVPKLAAQGAKVEFVTGSPQVNLAKLVAARGGEPPVDVMEITDGEVPRMVEGGFLQAIDFGAVPNAKDVLGDRGPNWVATWTTQEGICYNRAKFAELGIPAPKTYADLAHPKLEGRVQFPDIVSGGGLPAIAGISFASGGDLANIDPGLEAIRKLNVTKFWKTGSEAIAQFQSGDIFAAVIHSGWCVRARNAGLPVTTAHPVINDKTTGVVKEGFMVVVKGSKQQKAAAAWINEFLDPAFQAEFARKRGVVPANQKALAGAGSDPVVQEMMVLDPAAMARMLRVDYSKVDVSAWTDKWNRMVVKR